MHHFCLRFAGPAAEPSSRESSLSPGWPGAGGTQVLSHPSGLTIYPLAPHPTPPSAGVSRTGGTLVCAVAVATRSAEPEPGARGKPVVAPRGAGSRPGTGPFPRRPSSRGPLASLGGASPAIIDPTAPHPCGTFCSSELLASAPAVLRTHSPAHLTARRPPCEPCLPRGVSPRARGGRSGVKKARPSQMPVWVPCPIGPVNAMQVQVPQEWAFFRAHTVPTGPELRSCRLQTPHRGGISACVSLGRRREECSQSVPHAGLLTPLLVKGFFGVQASLQTVVPLPGLCDQALCFGGAVTPQLDKVHTFEPQSLTF